MAVDYTDEHRLRPGDTLRCLCNPTSRLGVVHAVAECLALLKIDGQADHWCERFERIARIDGRQ